MPPPNRPTKPEKLMPEGRRLEKGIRPVSKYANMQSGREEARRLADLEKSRLKLGLLIESYAKLLTDTTLPENRSAEASENQRNVLDSLPKAAAELDMRNVMEGTQSILIAVLSSSLILRDQVNKLKYQNYFLNQKVQQLNEPIDKGGPSASLAQAGEAKELSKNGTGE